jgi:A/G-specific adenine glycosylase
MPRAEHSSPPRAVQKRKPAKSNLLAAPGLQRRLLDWYLSVRRPLPWRAVSDPYAIWVSEVMLQQTQVQTVLPYYRRWLEAFPSVNELAQASEAEVMQHWQGLGYYSRARNLHKGAQLVVADGGVMPQDVAALRKLPGVGAYTAGAIASIALGQDEPAIDGNIERVLTRLFALSGDPKREPLRSALWERARELLPAGDAGSFNQALMELGALCCTPKKPLCEQCPVARDCKARAEGDPVRYPETAPRAKVTNVRTLAALAERAGRVLVVQLSSRAPRWAGLWVFPFAEESSQPRTRGAEHTAALALQSYAGLSASATSRLHALVHHITRYRIELELWAVSVARGRAKPSGDSAQLDWVTVPDLEQLAMPAPHRKLARWLLARGDVPGCS